jgi:uncharacterized protein DUF2784
MIDSLLADAVVLVHLGFIAFVMGGAILALRWRRAAWLHLPAAAWGAYVELAGRVCPLTPLELALRAKAGQAGYETSFIEHYLVPVIYPAELTPATQRGAGLFVVVVNLALYGLVLARARRTRRPE